jgi:hypothetical protein
MRQRYDPEPCMGGWCTARGSCAHYHSDSRMIPSERLCGPYDRAHLGWAPIMFRPQHVLEHRTLSMIHGTVGERGQIQLQEQSCQACGGAGCEHCRAVFDHEEAPW